MPSGLVTFRKATVTKGEGYRIYLDGHDIGYAIRRCDTGRWAALALVDQHAVTIPGIGKARSGSLETIREETPDGTFRTRSAAARAVVREFHKRGVRDDPRVQ